MRRLALPLAAILFATATGAAAQESIAPRNTPGLPENLVGIDDVLTGGLLNDPTNLAWDSYGTHLSAEPVVDESYPGGGAALRITMRQPGAVYSGGLNVPLLARVNSGEVLTVGFLARTIESSAEDGKGRVHVRFQLNEEPYPGFGDQTVEIDSEWGFYEVTTTASRALRNRGIVAFQFGDLAQTVEIGQTIVVSGTPTITD